MNNILGYKTDHSACILEQERLYVYKWMLKQILCDDRTGEFLCHLLDKYNSKFKTNYNLDQFPELVMQRKSEFCWWHGNEDDTDYSYLIHFDRYGISCESRMEYRSYVLSDAIEFLEN